jgi:hypothetical protein
LPRRPSKITKNRIAALLAGARTAGFSVARLEVDNDGRISMIIGDPEPAGDETAAKNAGDVVANRLAEMMGERNGAN